MTDILPRLAALARTTRALFLCALSFAASLAYSQTLDQAIAAAHESAMKEGAVLHRGQWGSLVEQYKDHYCDCQGLACACNPGQWKPQPTFDRDRPPSKGEAGENLFSADGKKFALWIKDKWIICDQHGCQQ